MGNFDDNGIELDDNGRPLSENEMFEGHDFDGCQDEPCCGCIERRAAKAEVGR